MAECAATYITVADAETKNRHTYAVNLDNFTNYFSRPAYCFVFRPLVLHGVWIDVRVRGPV